MYFWSTEVCIVEFVVHVQSDNSRSGIGARNELTLGRARLWSKTVNRWRVELYIPLDLRKRTTAALDCFCNKCKVTLTISWLSRSSTLFWQLIYEPFMLQNFRFLGINCLGRFGTGFIAFVWLFCRVFISSRLLWTLPDWDGRLFISLISMWTK